MLEQLKYINHQNEVFEFGKDGIFVETNDLRDYTWSMTKRNNKITALRRDISTRKLPVTIVCQTEEQATAAKNKLMEVVEKDVLALQHGRIVVGDYYFRCFVTKSQKKNYLYHKNYLTMTLTLTSDFPFWVKETTHIFRKVTEAVGGTNLDYPHDYSFDYFSGMGNKELNNLDFVPTNFRMIIYGACKNPAVYVSGHMYQMFCELLNGEYITIDSITKKIYKTAIDGTQTNVFNLRNRDSYIFEKIPAGTNTVIWLGDFGVDITLLEERSEPKWT